MIFAEVNGILIPEGAVTQITAGGSVIWAKKEDEVNLWDLAGRSVKSISWNSAGTALAYDVSLYYLPVNRAGAYNANGGSVTDIVIGEDSLSMSVSASLYGIAVPFRLDSSKQYRFQAVTGANTRIDMLNYNTSNVYQNYTNLGTSNKTIDYTFTPTEGTFTVFGMLASANSATPTFTGIKLTEV